MQYLPDCQYFRCGHPGASPTGQRGCMRCVVRRIDCEGDFICNRSINGYYCDMANRKRTDLSSLLERLIDAVSREIAARAGGGVRGGRRVRRRGPLWKPDMGWPVEGRNRP